MRRRVADSAPVTRSVRVRAYCYGALLTYFGLLGWTALRLAYFHKAFGSEMVIQSLFSSQVMQTGAGAGILRHLVIIFLLYLLFWTLLWRIADCWQTARLGNARNYIGGVVLIAFVGIYWALFTNAWIAPNSHYALLPVFGYSTLNGAISLSLAAVVACLGRHLVARLLSWRPGHGRAFARRYEKPDNGVPGRRVPLFAPARLVAVILASGIMVVGGHQISASISSYSAIPDQYVDRPNIILVGFDSLNVTGGQGHDAISMHMPNLSRYLEQSTRFAVAYTTVGRTFPAWTSVLTGQYPATSGVRANLQKIDPSEFRTVASYLRAAGYATTYATDERLFSNIDEAFGFDTVLGPEMGAGDFLIGQFGDTPLSNLLVNTRLGHFLFPHLHANRHAYYSYRPETFTKLLERYIAKNRGNSAEFLAMHFCLAHSPYLWGASLPESIERDDLANLYGHALAAVDQQFTDILASLESHGWLENALVIVFSDHGEQLGGKTLDFLAALPGENDLQHISALGHGSDLLSAEQSRILLAMRGYGAIDTGKPGMHWQPATTLVDIAPTVVDAVGLASNTVFTSEGISLLKTDNRAAQTGNDRPIFVETGLIVEALFAEELKLAEVAHETLNWYEVSAAGRVQIKENVFETLLNQKQFGVYGDGHLLVTQDTGRVDKEWFLSLDRGSPATIGTDAVIRDALRHKLQSYIAGRSLEQERVVMGRTYRYAEPGGELQ